MKFKKTIFIASIITTVISFYIILHKIAPVFVFILAFNEIYKDTWNEKNRIILGEVYSPDSVHKLGYYHYMEGAIGCHTATCISLIDKNDNYPLHGNITQVNSTPVVSWKSNYDLQLTIDTTGLYGPFPNTLQLSTVQINIIKIGKPN